MNSRKTEQGAVKNFLIQHKIGTLEQIKSLLGTHSTMTVFRKLKPLHYLSSYSDRGKYYTLYAIADFDKNGLWSFDSIRFSRHGNLIDTAKYLVDQSPSGLSAKALSEILHVDAKQALFNNFRQERLDRERISHAYIYFSTILEKKRQQMAMRKSPHAEIGLNASQIQEEVSVGLLITSAALSLKKRFSQALSASGYQISTEQYAVLSQLWNEDGIYQSDLARRVVKDRHNVSRIIKSLERKGLIIRKSDANDARLARCILTEEGRALGSPLKKISNQVLTDAFRGFGEREIRVLKRNMIHLLRNLGKDLFPLETADSEQDN